ncbi:MAG: LTA synthase family protein [Coprobacillus sp.]
MKINDSVKKLTLKNPIFYIFGSILFLELVLRIAVFQSIHFSFFYNFIFAMTSACIIGLLIRLTKKNINIIILSFFLFLLSLYFCSQILYFDFFKTFLTIYSISNGGQVAEFYKDIFQLILNNIHWIILCFIPFIFFISYGRKHVHMKKVHYRIILSYLGLSIVSFIIGYGMLYIPTKALNTPLDIYKEAIINETTVDQLGMMTAMRLDIQSFLFGRSDEIIDESVIEEPKEIKYDAQTMNIDFDKLIAETNDTTLKNMHTYFKNVTPTSKNKYTGMFKDYNVILMTCEGFSPYAINKEVTPTLYKLANEGFVFKDFYTPLWNVSTSDGEYVAMQGLIPKSGTWSFRDSATNSLPFTLGKQYQKLGYTTKAYHDHSYRYYDRHLSHPNLGYDYKGVGNGLKIKKQWPESDLEMMQVTIDDYINSDKFHTYYMTVSGHTNYTFVGNSMAAKNKNLVENLEYSDLSKGYLASQIELDKAMEYLIKRLEEAGKADKTLIVMSADHYPYGLPKKNYDELAGHELESNFEIEKNSLIMWSASMKEPIIVDKLGSSLDILPTVSNLLGLEYDSRLLMGTDLLSDSSPLVIFENKSFITDKVKYNAKTQDVEWLNGTIEDNEYLKKINTTVKQKIDYSKKILDYNYYKKVFQ